MIFYADRLSLRTLIALIRIVSKDKGSAEKKRVEVLDALPGKIFTSFLRSVFSLAGFDVEETEFFAGHLHRPDGQSVYMAAISAGNQIALTAAEKTVFRSPLLSYLNQQWGNNTIMLYLAQTLWFPSCSLAMHLMVADALARGNNQEDAYHIVEIPPAIDPSWIQSHFTSLYTKPYSFKQKVFRDSRIFIVLWLMVQKVSEIRGKLKRWGKPVTFEENNEPVLLLLQEDELSLNRSYRTQPHWLHDEDGPPPFRTIILLTKAFKKANIDRKKLVSMMVMPVSPEELFSASTASSHPFRRVIQKELRTLMRESILGAGDIQACAAVFRLFYHADLLAAFCLHNSVKAFMTCENYMIQANALRLISSVLGIHTISYQYSNMGEVSPAMMTTADTMFTFSPFYHERWARSGIGPRVFVDTGYLFDRSFKVIQNRARAYREKLEQSGAKFVICYLDESVQEDKYGLIHRDDRMKEIQVLIDYMLSDSSAGLVVKTQFLRNSFQNLNRCDELFSKVKRTGRYAELSHGTIRNIVFPAEAALCSDIVIGHSVGTTAALEAALAGVRSILLNPYGAKGVNDSLYSKADIVYPSLERALEAIKDYRNGLPERAGLGDWSPIISRFDPFRDGKSAIRLREQLEKILRTENIPKP